MNYNPENENIEPKGNKPIREASSVSEVFVLMIVHICKKILFFDTNLKIALYLGLLFLLSLIADVQAFPRTYFSRSDNVFNRYFVKIGWFWTLFLTIPFNILTSYTTCCGNKRLVLTAHLTRLLVATFFWFTWTSIYNYIEISYGRCNLRSYTDKVSCLKNGNFWNGFDLSGHCFILIYSSLVMIEEARAINGWEKIKDHIRDEQFARNISDKSTRINPLRNLTPKEFQVLKGSYEKYTPYVRGLLMAITILQVLWDVMLVSTILYYHIMIEKFLSGIIAILTWFITYRVWYPTPKIYPNMPGDATFKYNKEKATVIPPAYRKRKSVNNGKHFMGMPINKVPDTKEITPEETR